MPDFQALRKLYVGRQFNSGRAAEDHWRELECECLALAQRDDRIAWPVLAQAGAFDTLFRLYDTLIERRRTETARAEADERVQAVRTVNAARSANEADWGAFCTVRGALTDRLRRVPNEWMRIVTDLLDLTQGDLDVEHLAPGWRASWYRVSQAVGYLDGFGERENGEVNLEKARTRAAEKRMQARIRELELTTSQKEVREQIEVLDWNIAKGH